MNRLLAARMAASFLVVFATTVQAAGKLSVHDAWIAPGSGDTQASAGYATLGNSGDEPLRILSVQSDAFRAISLMKTVNERGTISAREMIDLKILPGATVSLHEGSMRLMLLDPRHPISSGDEVRVVFLLADGTRVPAIFDVAAAHKSGS
ncbi:MAG: copper chaperone PCu(A)C [Rhodanobacteraceae bacterium]